MLYDLSFSNYVDIRFEQRNDDVLIATKPYRLKMLKIDAATVRQKAQSLHIFAGNTKGTTVPAVKLTELLRVLHREVCFEMHGLKEPDLETVHEMLGRLPQASIEQMVNIAYAIRIPRDVVRSVLQQLCGHQIRATQ